MKCTLYHVYVVKCTSRNYSSQLLQLLGVLFGGRVALLRSCVASFVWFLTLSIDFAFYFASYYPYRVPIPNTEAEPGIVSELGQLSHSSHPLSEHVSFTFQSIQI